MTGPIHPAIAVIISFFLFTMHTSQAQLPIRYATLELFTNTPCPVCASQNPGFFERLEDFEGQYHLVSFYPGKPYSSCIFYQANTSENTARFNFYPQVAGTPTVVINGTQFKSSGSMSTSVLEDITGSESWLSVEVDETAGSSRTVDITLQDHVGSSLVMGKLYAVVVERLIMYNAPNGETMHHNVFRKFLTDTGGDDVDLSTGTASMSYQYDVDAEWQEDEVYVIAWLMDPDTEEIYNSGTRFDPNTTSTIDQEEEGLQIYPNPASAMLTITLPGEANRASVRIYDTGGRLVHNEVNTDDTFLRIVTIDWPAGTYRAEIILDGRVLSGQFQVVR